MAHPLVSIVIPVYNGARFITQAVQSAMAQQYNAVEIIVVDDGSEDETLQVLQPLQNDIRVESIPHSGACAARNLGVQSAAGTYIQFLDADDILLPQKIERQMEIIKQRSGTNVFIDCGYEEVDVAGAVIRVRRSDVDACDSLCMYVLKNNPVTSTPLLKKDILYAAGLFTEHLPCGQEFDLFLRCAPYIDEVLYVDESLFQYRQRPGSISADYQPVLEVYADILKRCLTFYDSHQGMTAEDRHALAVFAAVKARHCYRYGCLQAGHELSELSSGLDSGAWREAYSRYAQVCVRLFGPCKAENMLQSVRKRLP